MTSELSGSRSPHDAADLPRLAPVAGLGEQTWPEPVEQPRRTWVEQVMGMPIGITVRGPGLDERPGPPAVEAAVAAAFAALRHVDAVFSTWKDDSQVSRLRRGEITLADCDEEVREVARLCDTARERTGGWFDADLPDADGVRRFEPTGLVKGWAVERCADRLSAALEEDRPGGYDVLVNAGGDVAARCRRTDTPDWVVAVEDPRDRSRLLATLPLRVGGVATSGTAARGAHILDPATGLPVAGLASVSVIGPELLWADVHATAAFAQGPACVDRLRALPELAWLVVGLDGTVTTHASGTPDATATS